MSRHFSAAIWAACTIALLSAPAAAQTVGFGTMNCSERPCFTHANHPAISGLSSRSGDNLEAILKALDDSGEKYRKALLAAHANEDSVKVSNPTLPGGLPNMDYQGSYQLNGFSPSLPPTSYSPPPPVLVPPREVQPQPNYPPSLTFSPQQ